MASSNPKALASNRSRSLEFRRLIAAQLRGEGITTAQPKPLTMTLAESFAEGFEEGDIRGLPGGWLLNVRYGQTYALASTLDEAEIDAQTDGKLKVAIVTRRLGSGPERAFVTMSLATFAAMLKDGPQ
jgi:hypothetical protein